MNTESLSPMVPTFDNSKCSFPTGTNTKQNVHEQGLWHRTALLLVVCKTQVLVVERGKHQSYPGMLDLTGGHEDVIDEGKLVNTAFREASEELLFKGASDSFTPNHFSFLGSLTVDISLPNGANREKSSLFGIHVNSQALAVCDIDDNDKIVELKTDWLSYKQFVGISEDSCADGLRRVINRINNYAEFRSKVHNFVTQNNWRVCFADHLPGEPGTGGMDNDVFYEEPMYGTYTEVKLEAEEIRWSRFRGDLLCWIEPDES